MVASLAILGSLAFAGEAGAASARNVYVANAFAGSVAWFPSPANTTPATTISSVTNAGQIAITPDGSIAYVVEIGNLGGNVARIDTSTNAVVGSLIPVGQNPESIAISPDGSTVYVGNGNPSGSPAHYTISVISTTTNTVTGSIDMGTIAAADRAPDALAISPDGNELWAATRYSTVSNKSIVTVIDLPANTIDPGSFNPIALGTTDFPTGIAFTPDGSKAYVSNNVGQNVTAIDPATHTVSGTIPLGAGVSALAVSPDGSEVYAAKGASPGSVSVIDTSTNTLDPSANNPITVGYSPNGVAFSPDGSYAYVTNGNQATASDPAIVSVINTATMTAGTPIVVGAFGANPHGLAIVPDQGPTANFSETSAQAGSPTGFDGSASSDPEVGGTIAGYQWNFGDGNVASTASATTSHTYGAGGNYDVTLTVTDNEGCSDLFVFTGQTAYCNPNTVSPAQKTSQVTIAAAPTSSGPPASGGSSGPTGQRAAALKKCKKKKSAPARQKCKKSANKLPV